MPPPGENLTGIGYFFLIVPVVLALFGWIGAVYWASYHRQVHRISEPVHSAMARGAADEGPGPDDRAAGAPGWQAAGPAARETARDDASSASPAPAGAVPWQQGAQRQVPRQPGGRPRAGQPRPPAPEPTGAGPTGTGPTGTGQPPGRGGRSGSGRGQ
jgi:hypothetical protein